ncbi:hypothetical protein BC829DRAFT_407836 [Chytridium lagenaria]|nr:hypothetical protein BC829DRAFT_407836 [Chytridium lagenaria]
MVGAVIGLLFIGAMVAYFRSMSRRTRPDPTKPSGPVLKDPGESKTMTRTMVRPDMSTMRYGNGSTAQFSQESSYNGGVGTIHNGSYGAGAASQYSQQPAAGAYDTMRGPGTMNPGASATPYASSIAPTTMQRGPQQYPTLSAYHQGYSEPQQQDEEQKVYTVEQYLASGWTMEQIESFKTSVASLESFK